MNLSINPQQSTINPAQPHTADSNPIHRTTLVYTVEYKRKIADPTLIS